MTLAALAFGGGRGGRVGLGRCLAGLGFLPEQRHLDPALGILRGKGDPEPGPMHRPQWLRMSFNHNSGLQNLPGGIGRCRRVNHFVY